MGIKSCYCKSPQASFQHYSIPELVHYLKKSEEKRGIAGIVITEYNEVCIFVNSSTDVFHFPKDANYFYITNFYSEVEYCKLSLIKRVKLDKEINSFSIILFDSSNNKLFTLYMRRNGLDTAIEEDDFITGLTALVYKLVSDCKDSVIND